jgi:hypothetical protein
MAVCFRKISQMRGKDQGSGNKEYQISHGNLPRMQVDKST